MPRFAVSSLFCQEGDMSERGLRYRPKQREAPAKREPSISSTSGARKALDRATPEDRPALEAKVREAHPDMLIERRRSI
jgi:hypothetical protein